MTLLFLRCLKSSSSSYIYNLTYSRQFLIRMAWIPLATLLLCSLVIRSTHGALAALSIDLGHQYLKVALVKVLFSFVFQYKSFDFFEMF